MRLAKRVADQSFVPPQRDKSFGALFPVSQKDNEQNLLLWGFPTRGALSGKLL